MKYGSARVSRTLFALLITGALLASVAVAYGQADKSASIRPLAEQFLPITDDNLLVLEVRINRKSTGHGLIAYRHEDKVLLPLAELCSILELAINVQPRQGRANGWIVDESRPFNLNLAMKTVTVNDNISPLSPDRVGFDENDLYVDQGLIEQWLPIIIEVNLPRMHVTIIPQELLPFQSRLHRDEQRSQWLTNRGRPTLSYPLQITPYRLWSWPLVDATLGLYSPEFGMTRRLSLQSSFDAAGLSTSLFMSHAGNTQHSQTRTRIRAGRWSPNADLLASAHATSYEFGDLYIGKIPLISTSKQGVGFTISNHDLHNSRQFDTTEIHGNAPPGWEAELYINGSLFDFLSVDESGEYNFTDIPLIIGQNIFRTVLYGPRGETREVVKHANISTEMSSVGEMKYTATVIRGGRSLVSSAPVSFGAMSDSWNQQIELAYALNNSSALVANLSRLNLDNHSEVFSSLESHNSLGPVYLRTIFARSLRGGSAVSVGGQTRLLGHNLTLRQQWNNDYRAEAIDSQYYVSRQNLLRASGHFSKNSRRFLSYNISSIDRDFSTDKLLHERETQVQASSNFRKFVLSHSLRHRKRNFADETDLDVIGTQLVRSWLGPFAVRGDLVYQLSPGLLRSVSTTLNLYRISGLRATLRGSHFFRRNFGPDNITADLTQYFDSFSVGLNFSAFNNKGPAIGMTVGTSVAKDIRSSHWTRQYRRLSNRCVASARAFIDLNGNHVFDPEDEPLAGVGFRNLEAWNNIRTGKDGIALLPGLVVHRPQTIELNLSTVDNPFLTAQVPGINVVGHPGGIIELEFSFNFSGEVEGVIIDADAPDRPVHHVGLELVNMNGERVHTTVGEFDGYYYFPSILPGEYDLRVIATTIDQTRFKIPSAYPITIPGAGGFVEGPEIVLTRLALPVEVDAIVAQASDAAASMQTGPAPAVLESIRSLDLDEEVMLSLIYEMLFRNTLWPEPPEE